jgi:hypothetical protein
MRSTQRQLGTSEPSQHFLDDDENQETLRRHVRSQD